MVLVMVIARIERFKGKSKALKLLVYFQSLWGHFLDNVLHGDLDSVALLCCPSS